MIFTSNGEGINLDIQQTLDYLKNLLNMLFLKNYFLSTYFNYLFDCLSINKYD